MAELSLCEPQVLDLTTWEVPAITAGTVVVFGIFITAICSIISVNKFLRSQPEHVEKKAVATEGGYSVNYWKLK